MAEVETPGRAVDEQNDAGSKDALAEYVSQESTVDWW